MDEAEQDALRDVLVAYFGDESRASGIRGLLSVTRQDVTYHERYRGALAAGARAAAAGDADALAVARSLAPLLPDVAAAEALIRGILADYDHHYAAGTTPAED